MAETNSIANFFDINDPHIKIEYKVEKKPYGYVALKESSHRTLLNHLNRT